jgi:hypothetical protein
LISAVKNFDALQISVTKALDARHDHVSKIVCFGQISGRRFVLARLGLLRRYLRYFLTGFVTFESKSQVKNDLQPIYIKPEFSKEL